MQNKTTRIEYMCSWCGQKQVRPSEMGRPQPGNCSRRPRNSAGKPQPHSWVINRKL